MELLQYNSPILNYDNFEVELYEEEGWFLVFIAVLLALGATVVLGAAVWCITKGHGKFTGAAKWESGLKISIECS